ncbi:MAG: hypothetical protein BWY63_03824 [Chloroflexi bacterium ADurb.Bin360]|nr:MAG: hypothetical protein BWY63_03824 [Chloroflexi bacterium ADurb.Bin360]
MLQHEPRPGAVVIEFIAIKLQLVGYAQRPFHQPDRRIAQQSIKAQPAQVQNLIPFKVNRAILHRRIAIAQRQIRQQALHRHTVRPQRPKLQHLGTAVIDNLRIRIAPRRQMPLHHHAHFHARMLRVGQIMQQPVYRMVRSTLLTTFLTLIEDQRQRRQRLR